MRTAGIIGGSGFIGSHVTKRFLAEGFLVRASTTDIDNAGKYGHLEALENAEKLEMRQLDCRDLAGTREFVEGCDVVVHAGTPFQLEFGDPQAELLEPTLDGTTNLLQAVSEAHSVRTVVIVASVGALNTGYPMPVPGRSHDHVYTEADAPHFGDADHPYAQAKYHADQAVRRFMAENPEPGFDIISVYPVGVMGASLSTRADSTSSGLQFLFRNRIAPNPFVQMLYDTDAEFAIVDVRDVAEGIFQAAVRPGLHGRSYYLSNESWTVSDISRMLNAQTPDGEPRRVYSGDAAVRELGLAFRPASESFEAYARSAPAGAAG